MKSYPVIKGKHQALGRKKEEERKTVQQGRGVKREEVKLRKPSRKTRIARKKREGQRAGGI